MTILRGGGMSSASRWLRPFVLHVPERWGYAFSYSLLTPDGQVIVEPSNNPAQDLMALFGMRLRVDF